MDRSQIISIIQKANDIPGIVLLKQESILQWLYRDFSFLTLANKENEDNWGRSMLKSINPDYNKKEWTGPLGERIAKEILLLSGYKNPQKPKKINGVQPDLETTDSVWEIKNGTYFTPGTAHEKVLGVPLKYSEVPKWFDKPLVILCMGRAEEIAKTYNLDMEDITQEGTNRYTYLQMINSMNISFITATTLLDFI